VSTPDPSSITYFAHRCVRADGHVSYINASPSRWWVELFNSALLSTDAIVKLRIRERVADDAPSPYYGWIDSDRPDRYTYVFGTEVQLETVFPYGSRAEADRGRGRKVNLIVEEVAT
jgi:hypothetical protein